MFQAKTEVSTLVFARVFKVVVDTATAKEGPSGKAYDHYFGFAQVEKHHMVHSGKTVFFKRATHLSRKDGFFFGSVPHRPGYTTEGDITHSGDVVVGHVRETPKGLAYVWWTHRARAFLHFKSLLHNPSKMTNEARTFSMLRRRGVPGDNDDLYLMARVLLKKDVDVLVEQLLPEDQRRRHPSKKDGFQKKRGFDVCFHPVEIAYFLSVFSKDLELYDTFVARLQDHRGSLEDWPDHELRTYSRDRLERNIAV